MFIISKKLKDGKRIARITSGPNKNKFIYLKEEITDADIKESIKSMNRKDIEELEKQISEGKYVSTVFKNEIKTQGKLQPMPQKGKIERIYISGPSGSGKSHYAGKYVKEYLKMYPGNEFYVISTIGDDNALDEHDPDRIEVDDEFLIEPPTPEYLRDSITVFDDVDKIARADLRKSVQTLRSWELEQGRHFNTSMLCTSHLLFDYSQTKRLLNEATTVVLFPRAGSQFHIKKYLEKYMGLDREQRTKILKLPSRWVALYTGYPQYVIHEKGVFMLNQE